MLPKSLAWRKYADQEFQLHSDLTCCMLVLGFQQGHVIPFFLISFLGFTPQHSQLSVILEYFLIIIIFIILLLFRKGMGVVYM